MPGGQGATNFTAIASGYFHNLGIRADRTVFTWAMTTPSRSLAVPVGLTNVVGISGGAHFSLALRADGTVAAWGENTFGQTNVPAGLTNVIGIAVGTNHCLAV